MELINRMDFRLDRNFLPARYFFEDVRIPIYLPKTYHVIHLPFDYWVCEDWIKEVVFNGKWEVGGVEIPERVWIRKGKEIEIDVVRGEDHLKVKIQEGKEVLESKEYKVLISKRDEENPIEKVLNKEGETMKIMVLGELPEYRKFSGYSLEDKFEGYIYKVDIKNDTLYYVDGKGILVVERKFVGEVKLLREIENYIGIRSAEVPKRILIEVLKFKDVGEALEYLKRRYSKYL